MIRRNFVAIIFAIIVLIANQCASYRILCIFPTPAASHQIVFRAYTQALAEHGHELVVATTHPVTNPHPNITQIDWSDVNLFWQKHLDFTTASKDGLISIIFKYINGFSHVLDIELSHPDIQYILKNPEKQNFDLVIAENHFISLFEFARLLKVPLLVVCSSDPNVMEHEAVGNYVHSIAAPLRMSATFGLMSFYERLKAKSMDFFLTATGFFMERAYTDVLTKHFGPNLRSMHEIVRDIDMLLINVNPAFGYIRPITPKTVTLGFMHITEPKPLPTDLQNYLDNSVHGVIYCSFGTNVHPEKFDGRKLNAMMEAFGRLKYDILYKYGNDTMENKPSNVKLVKWVQQQDLLAHKKIKLFITQGGQHSIEEAIYREVPLLAVPFFGDQFANAKRIQGRGLGKWLDSEKMTSHLLQETIEEITEHPKYKENVANLGKIVKDEPMSPTKKAVWWTEYVIRHNGAKHLEYHGVHVPTYQIYYLDVISAYVLIFVLLVIVIKYLVKIIVKLGAGLVIMVTRMFCEVKTEPKVIKND